MDSSKPAGAIYADLDDARELGGVSLKAPAAVPAVTLCEYARPTPPVDVRPEGLLTVLWRGKIWIAAATMLALVLALGYLRLTPRIYTASAKVMIMPSGSALGPGTDDQSAKFADRNTQCALIKSIPVIQSALQAPELARVKSEPAASPDPVQWVKGGLTAEVDRTDDLLTISFGARNPHDAADVVNAVVRAYATFDLRSSGEDAAGRLVHLQAEEAKQQAILAKQSEAILALKRDAGTLSFDPGATNVIFNRVDSLAQALTKAELDSIDAKATADSAQSAATQRLYKIALDKESTIQVELKAEQQAAMALDAKAAEFHRLDSEHQRTQEMVDLLDKRIKEIAIGGDTGSASVRLLEPADAAQAQAKPATLKTLGAAVAVGILLGILAAIVRDRMDYRLRFVEEVAVATGSPVVGVVPRIPQLRRPFPARRPDWRLKQVWMRPQSGAAESFRTLRTGVCLNMVRGGLGRVVLVTSPTRGDGKSTVMANLAVATVQAGRRVLLIDADMRRPIQHELLGVCNDMGLSNLLPRYSRGMLSAAIRQTRIAGLKVLPCGPLPHNPSELLTGEGLPMLISVVRKYFDLVLIDSPPLNPVTDARLLSTMCDDTLLVVRADRTTQYAAESARDALASVGRRVWGTVINDSRGASGFRAGYGVQEYGYPRRLPEKASLGSAKRFDLDGNLAAALQRMASDDADSVEAKIEPKEQSPTTAQEPEYVGLVVPQDH